MNLVVENLRFSEMWPGALKETAGRPSAVSNFVSDSASLDFPEPGIPETMITFDLPSVYFTFSTRRLV